MASHITRVEILSSTSIRVYFSDVMNSLAELETEANYTLSPALTVSIATASSTRRECTLTIAAMTLGEDYTLTVASPPITGATDGDLANTVTAFSYGQNSFHSPSEDQTSWLGKAVLKTLKAQVHEGVPAQAAGSVTVYYQRIRDAGAANIWVYYSGETPTNAPAYASTSPVATGPLTSASWQILRVATEAA